jgi:hypothetical protein
MKIVINTCFGGFSLSEYAMTELGLDWRGDGILPNEMPRNDPRLVKVVEDLGEASWGSFARLKVVEIPDDVEWFIHDYDGIEHVAEVHRTWS